MEISNGGLGAANKHCQKPQGKSIRQTRIWASHGSYSLKADVSLGGGNSICCTAAPYNFCGKSQLTATVKHAAFGSPGSGIQAKLYVKTGNGYAWFDGGIAINTSGGTTLTLNLTGVSNLSDVREVGLQFLSPTNRSRICSIYLDNVTVQ